MLQLSGEVINVFVTDRKVTKDGEAYGGDPKVQLMANVPLENGGVRVELVDLKVKDAKSFQGLKGKHVQIPVGAFAPAKGQVVYFQTGAPIAS